MQRREPEGIVISCDFCGEDWDEIKPMIEGHHGSVICLDCVKFALQLISTGEGTYTCTMCLRDLLPADLARWSHPDKPDHANPNAVICNDCLRQAAGTFSKDPDVDFKWDPRAGARGK